LSAVLSGTADDPSCCGDNAVSVSVSVSELVAANIIEVGCRHCRRRRSNVVVVLLLSYNLFRDETNQSVNQLIMYDEHHASGVRYSII